MKIKVDRKLLSVLFIFAVGKVLAQEGGLLARWKLDEIYVNDTIEPLELKGKEAPEIDRSFCIMNEVTEEKARVYGTWFKLLLGISGNALPLDGNARFVLCSQEYVQKLSRAFNKGAWIALGAYPTYWYLFADQSTDKNKGCFLGLTHTDMQASKWSVMFQLLQYSLYLSRRPVSMKLNIQNQENYSYRLVLICEQIKSICHN
jgi:hypothetical protein